MKKIHINLCANCIAELKNYNPWVDKDGNTIEIEEMDLEEVPERECYNYTVGGEFVNEEKATWYL